MRDIIPKNTCEQLDPSNPFTVEKMVSIDTISLNLDLIFQGKHET